MIESYKNKLDAAVRPNLRWIPIDTNQILFQMPGNYLNRFLGLTKTGRDLALVSFGLGKSKTILGSSNYWRNVVNLYARW